MTTETDIANMALALLDEAPITNIDDDNTAARLVKLHFATTRKSELAAHDWQFALTTGELTGVDTGSGSGTLNWEYTLPAGVLRVLPLTYDNTIYGIPISWEARSPFSFSIRGPRRHRDRRCRSRSGRCCGSPPLPKRAR